MAVRVETATVGEHFEAERRFFGGSALTMLALTFIGFAPSYYLAPLTGAPAVPIVVHIHAAVFTGWMLLYVAQNMLVAARRRDLHQLLGISGAFLIPAIVVAGYCTVILTANGVGGVAARLGRVPILFPLAAVLAFGVLAGIGLARRSDAATHKRLMYLATTSLVMTPLARIAGMFGSPLMPPINGMLLSDLLVGALAVFDWRTRGCPHRATAWGAGLLLLSQPLRVLIDRSEPWQATARWLLG